MRIIGLLKLRHPRGYVVVLGGVLLALLLWVAVLNQESLLFALDRLASADLLTEDDAPAASSYIIALAEVKEGRAIQVATNLQSPATAVLSLSRAAISARVRGKADVADRLVNAAGLIADRTPGLDDRSALRTLSLALAYAGRFEEAAQRLAALDPQAREEGLSWQVTNWMDARGLRYALDRAEQLRGPARSQAFVGIAFELARDSEFVRAKEIAIFAAGTAETLSSASERITALVNAAEAVAVAGDTTEARLMIARAARGARVNDADPREHLAALSRLVINAARLGHWDVIDNVLAPMMRHRPCGDSGPYDFVFSRPSRVALSKGRPLNALRYARSIGDCRLRSDLILEISALPLWRDHDRQALIREADDALPLDSLTAGGFVSAVHVALRGGSPHRWIRMVVESGLSHRSARFAYLLERAAHLDEEHRPGAGASLDSAWALLQAGAIDFELLHMAQDVASQGPSPLEAPAHRTRRVRMIMDSISSWTDVLIRADNANRASARSEWMRAAYAAGHNDMRSDALTFVKRFLASPESDLRCGDVEEASRALASFGFFWRALWTARACDDASIRARLAGDLLDEYQYQARCRGFTLLRAPERHATSEVPESSVLVAPRHEVIEVRPCASDPMPHDLQ